MATLRQTGPYLYPTWLPKLLVLQRRFKEGCLGRYPGPRGVWRETDWLARSLHSCVCFSHRSSSAGPNRSRGSISRTTR